MQEINLLDIVEVAEEVKGVPLLKGQNCTVVEYLTVDMVLVEIQSDKNIGLDGLFEVPASALRVIKSHKVVNQAS